MFNVVNLISSAVVASASERVDAESILKQIDTIPSSHEIVEVVDVAE